MNLELKHLAPYLPYKLKVRCDKTTYIHSAPKRVGVVDSWHCDYNEVSISTDSGYYLCCISDCKPILHPLSDLTKEIEINEEKFIPLEKINEYSISDYYVHEINGTLYLLSNHRQGYNVLSEVNPLYNLLEWHFDLYGLIDASLAIDVNTL